MTVPAAEYLCWPIEPGCSDEEWQTFTPEVQERATILAVETLRTLTAYRVGGCPITVRPCRQPCTTPPTYATYPAPGVGGNGGPVDGWHPALHSGTWVNIACGCTTYDCSCGPLQEIVLPGGIAQVTEVTLDGAALDPTAYVVHDGMRLVRIDGGVWPSCQDMTAALDADGSFGVTYVTGSLPGRLGAIAAGRLAYEYAKACVGASCALPPRVRTVARQGVTLELATAEGDPWPSGLTGIREVDAFIRRHNPHALKTPSAVWSPDVRRPRRVP